MLTAVLTKAQKIIPVPRHVKGKMPRSDYYDQRGECSQQAIQQPFVGIRKERGRPRAEILLDSAGEEV